MDPAIVEKAEREDLAFGQAVALGASCEPPKGLPHVPDVVAALQKLDADIFVVVEQDMYPVDFDQAGADRGSHPRVPAQRRSRNPHVFVPGVGVRRRFRITRRGTMRGARRKWQVAVGVAASALVLAACSSVRRP